VGQGEAFSKCRQQLPKSGGVVITAGRVGQGRGNCGANGLICNFWGKSGAITCFMQSEQGLPRSVTDYWSDQQNSKTAKSLNRGG